MFAKSRVTVPVWSIVPARLPSRAVMLRVQTVADVEVQAGESLLSA
jgi:hypothetical protein